MILEYKGISVFYTDQGKGQSVVLLHGFLESSTMWQHIVPEILNGNRIIAIDLLGHGQTGCLGYIHTMELMAEVVKAVLDHLKINTMTFIGHSMGGYVALAYAEKYPSKINGLCLMNSSASEDDDERKKNRDRAILAVKQNHKIFISMAIANLFRPINRLIFSNEIEQLKDEAFQMPLQGIIAAIEGMKIRKNLELLLRDSGYKKMMIIGRKDPVLNNDILRSQTKNTAVEIIELPDGHMSHIENKREITHIIKQFI